MPFATEGPLATIWSRSAPVVTERESDYEKPLRVACETLRHSSPGLIPGVTVLLHADTREEVEEISERAYRLANGYGLVAKVVPYDRHLTVRYSRAAGSDPLGSRR